MTGVAVQGSFCEGMGAPVAERSMQMPKLLEVLSSILTLLTVVTDIHITFLQGGLHICSLQYSLPPIEKHTNLSTDQKQDVAMSQ